MPVTTTLTESTVEWQARANLPQVTLRSTLAGLAIGSIILVSNFQFGLQTGWVSMMSLPSALLGFAIFKAAQDHLSFKFTDVENVFVQSVSVAVATGPLAYGFVGIIPAIEKMMTDEESGYEGGIDLKPLWKLVLWALGLAFFGVFFAVPLRKQFIIKEKLPFPSGSATATLISVFHGTTIRVGDDDEDDEVDEVPHTDNESLEHSSEQDSNRIIDPQDSQEVLLPETEQSTSTQHLHSQQDELPQYNPNNLTIIESQDLYRLQQVESYRTNIKLLITTASVSSMYTVISYFIPQIKALPVFGSHASQHYLLNFQPSPAYVGQGIIMGFATTMYMFFGMILGWCILSPLAQSKGWAPGPIDDWKEGSEGWIMWISLSIMISDSVVSLAVTVFKAINSLVTNFNDGSYHGVRDAGEHQELLNGDEIQSDEDITSSTYHGETNNSDSSLHSGNQRKATQIYNPNIKYLVM
ncbi:unnamed protein product [Ambrosiozyma monospora]|uniref:Unnamed protein product n=1 Tax=Ambrosiozyma monospora TaxID=43982 RepID=A0ACB5TRA5_AMBMO|nr:unnamed protein product [Ambrosiozyma monospora]